MDCRTIAEGFSFTESPRWHQGKLFFSDFYLKQVQSVNLNGDVSHVVDIPHQPSGLGWTPNGDLLVISMTDRRLMKFDGTELREVADLSTLASWHTNDMVVSDNGTAYVGNFGFDIGAGKSPCTANLIKVDPAGQISVAAAEMEFANGAVIFNNGRTLVVAETLACRLTAFSIDNRGELSDRRVWADLGEVMPDGICVDKEQGIWVAAPLQQCVIRVEEGGNVSQRYEFDRHPLACALGAEKNDDGEFLFICTTKHFTEEDCLAHRSACIEVIRLA